MNAEEVIPRCGFEWTRGGRHHVCTLMRGHEERTRRLHECSCGACRYEPIGQATLGEFGRDAFVSGLDESR